eukprot:CAMPEP_0177490010 /NCGR_PEP_ID=MMETSP0369-20130122/31026_1 /TAXON_ID=447022 ORGANISM="Scrippsiella hangoei-like, Strain SHHI-4" /NCGR_SAMPLE_ID=MMETSP0369 /ASSEMBLY_ACC=CAM_ASM_000364 /LENGTH=160 /DNA_ID=CAMNT_0018966547 /DNA_START=55 /DNA_END=538 /DNA_ORIENTATION=+
MVEVHIPKKGIWGRLVPPPKEEQEDLPDNLQLLRATEYHEVAAIANLERSNGELEAVLQCEEDEDFRLAIVENLSILAQKRTDLARAGPEENPGGGPQCEAHRVRAAQEDNDEEMPQQDRDLIAAAGGAPPVAPQQGAAAAADAAAVAPADGAFSGGLDL